MPSTLAAAHVCDKHSVNPHVRCASIGPSSWSALNPFAPSRFGLQQKLVADAKRPTGQRDATSFVATAFSASSRP